ncbi:hypothetical protein [Peribacillus muralis]|uniref:hypothetical protein n=1 Tax=Peribacillus muralis TaxID=264697 RepID=UPI000AD043A8|nr:hypothetical protein [Peribacillus muralis]
MFVKGNRIHPYFFTKEKLLFNLPILEFKLPNTLFFVLGAGFVINMIAIEIKYKDSK